MLPLWGLVKDALVQVWLICSEFATGFVVVFDFLRVVVFRSDRDVVVDLLFLVSWCLLGFVVSVRCANGVASSFFFFLVGWVVLWGLS